MNLIIITAVLFVLFVGLSLIILGVQPSISAIYKALPSKWKWLFVLFMFILGGLCIAIGSNNAMTIMGFGCFFVGSFPRFYDDQGFQHYIGALAIISAGMWHVGVVLELWILPLIFGIITIIILLFNVRNKILWIELSAFAIMIFGLVFEYSHELMVKISLQLKL